MGRKQKFDDRLEGTAPVVAPVAAKRKKKKIWLLLVLAVVAVVVIWLVVSAKNASQQIETMTNQIEIAPVEQRDLSDTISLKGTVAGISSVNVTSKAFSEVTAVNVQLGDVVKKGDVLCTLDSASIQEQITDLEKSISNTSAINNLNSKQARDALAQAKKDQETALADAQLEITHAEESYNGTKMLYDRGEADFPTLLAAQRAVEAARKSYDSVVESTTRAILSAENAVRMDSYQSDDSKSGDTLKSLKEQLEDCEIKAPCGGVITAINVSVGDINTDKLTLMTIEDTSKLKMVASVTEANILKLQEGMKAVLTADATGEEEIDGEITRVVRVKAQASVQDAGGGGYSVELSVNNKELLIGMAIKAKVMVKDKGLALAVPYDLIRYDESGNAYVLTAEKQADGMALAKRVDIEAGEEVDYYTEILGGDLKEGDYLVYDYAGTLNDGDTFSAFDMSEFGAMGMDGDMSGAGTGAEVMVN